MNVHRNSCEHLPSTISTKIQKVILSTLHRVCEKDKETDVWACLTCAHFGCGRHYEAHAKEHAKASKHPLAIHISSASCFCYICDDIVQDRYWHGDLNILKRMLLEQSFPNSTVSATRSGKLIHPENQTMTTNDRNNPNRVIVYVRNSRIKATPSPESELPQIQTRKSTRKATQLSKSLQSQREELKSEHSKPVTNTNNNVVTNKVSSNANKFVHNGSKQEENDEEIDISDDMFDLDDDEPIINRLNKRKRQKQPNSKSSRKRRRTKSIEIRPGQIGLRNLGNTCFMNAVLQALSNTERFRKYFLDLPEAAIESQIEDVKTAPAITSDRRLARLNRNSTTKACLSLELKKLLESLWAGGTRALSPNSMLATVWQVLPLFHGYRQQDSHEFLRFLLDKIHEETIKISKSKGMKKSDIVKDTFQGCLLNEVTCTKCGKTSKRREPFLDISLDVPSSTDEENNSVTLQECIARFTHPESLDNSTKYFCNFCGFDVAALKKFTVASLPNVLCIHLKRFRWSTSLSKVTTLVDFPLNLDLRKFTTETTRTTYSLFGVINHHGYTVGHGHYTAYCLNKDEDAWLGFDDSNVRQCSLDDLKHSKAYILFYARNGT